MARTREPGRQRLRIPELDRCIRHPRDGHPHPHPPLVPAKLAPIRANPTWTYISLSLDPSGGVFIMAYRNPSRESYSLVAGTGSRETAEKNGTILLCRRP